MELYLYSTMRAVMAWMGAAGFLLTFKTQYHFFQGFVFWGMFALWLFFIGTNMKWLLDDVWRSVLDVPAL